MITCANYRFLVQKAVHIFKKSSKDVNAYFRVHSSAMMLSDCSRLGTEYYSTPLLGQHMVNYVVQPWKHLPNYRLRNFIHILSLIYFIRLFKDHYIKPMTHVYMRERHGNKNTRFWATMA